MGKEKKLHGNYARVDPEQKVESLFESNAVTLPQTGRDRAGGKPPAANDALVEDARRFSQENQT